MQSLQDEDEKDDNDKAPHFSNSGSSAISLNFKTDADSSNRISSSQSAAELATASPLPEDEASLELEDKLSNAKPTRLTPQLTPSGSPKKQSSAGSPVQQSAYGSPRWNSTTDARLSVTSIQSTSEHTAGRTSPPARTHFVDGKEFFRQARTRLSYEQFSTFLGIIKELNAHRQTKEETLRKAEEIFGLENKDLYVAFDGLLSRHLPAT